MLSNRIDNHMVFRPCEYVYEFVVSYDCQKFCHILDTEMSDRPNPCYANDDDWRELVHREILRHIRHKPPSCFDAIPCVYTEIRFTNECKWKINKRNLVICTCIIYNNTWNETYFFPSSKHFHLCTFTFVIGLYYGTVFHISYSQKSCQHYVPTNVSASYVYLCTFCHITCTYLVEHPRRDFVVRVQQLRLHHGILLHTADNDD